MPAGVRWSESFCPWRESSLSLFPEGMWETHMPSACLLGIVFLEWQGGSVLSFYGRLHQKSFDIYHWICYKIASENLAPNSIWFPFIKSSSSFFLFLFPFGFSGHGFTYNKERGSFFISNTKNSIIVGLTLFNKEAQTQIWSHSVVNIWAH